MAASKGVQPILTYAASGAVAANLAALAAIIPNPDSYVGATAYGGGFPPSSGMVAGGLNGANNSYLDEMSPATATQLQIELAAIAAAQNVATGSYVLVAGDVTNNFVNLPTGLAAFTLLNVSWRVKRAGAFIADDLTPSQAVAGTLKLSHNSTYTLTAGDIVNWSAS